MLQPRRVILILAAVLSINALLPRSVAFGLGNLIQPLVQLLVTPGRPIYHTLGGLRQSPALEDEFVGLPDHQLRSDLGIARVQIEQLRQQNARLTERLAELMPVLDLLAERGLDQLRQLSARVTPGSAQGVLSIAAGSDDGIAPGQTVVYNIHAVGRVVEPVTARSASVALLTRIGGSLRVTIAPPANASLERPPLPARLRLDPNLNAFVTEDVAATAVVSLGDVVRLADELSFPEAQGFQLGRVVRVDPLPSNPLTLLRIVVEPALDLERIPRVTVLIPAASAPAASNNPGARP